MARIDSLAPGTKVTLKFHNSSSNEGYTLTPEFVSINGTGDDRTATFNDGGAKFDVYRYMGRWAACSDARKVSLVPAKV